ncbi:RNA-directed DNA polymerase, eukaryota, reverse transcriptase zinc-binding domain protein [Tanacetum coccineum]
MTELKVAVWNVKGLNQDKIQKEVIQLIKEEKLNVSVVIESYLNANKLAKACSKTFRNWSWESNSMHSRKGCRIIASWNDADVRIMLIHTSAQSILCLLEDPAGSVNFYCSFIYAKNKGVDRRVLWEELKVHHLIANENPWVLMGDFNVTLSLVDDLCSSGLFFTWTKNPKAIILGVMKKLDRVMVNESFIQENGSAHPIFLPYLTSVHSPRVLNIPKKAHKKKKSFRLANYVCDKEEFFPIVKQEWKKEIMGCQMFKLVKKLKMLKPKLNALNWKHGNIFDKVVKLRDLVKEKQRIIDKDPHNGLLKNDMVNTLNEYQEAMLDEEKLLFQKAKIERLKEGDNNTVFFHKVIKGRLNKSRIETVCNNKGERIEGEKVETEFVTHFKDFLGKVCTVSPIEDSDNLFSKKLTDEEANWMIREDTDKEIKDAMFNIGDNKAPGPDGFTSTFFKKDWGIVGNDICKAIREFFTNGKLLGKVNATVISLVSKIPTPNKVIDYRMIACCNVMYKCISEVLTNRIKDALNNLVNKNQSAFIPGRLIQDNIMLIQEFLMGYNRKIGGKRVAFKIDIQKAYDTINWNFLEEALKQFFTLILERKIKQNPEFKYHKGCKDFKITHLCFVDDLVVLCHGDKKSVEVIKDSLEEFSSYSSLLPNPSKSTVFFGNVGNDERVEILSIMPFSVGTPPVKYSGVPLITKRLGIKLCRLQLISSVLSSIQVYWSSMFLLSTAVVKEINRLLNGFLWVQGELTSGKAKIAWSEVCKPKANGGLGIKNLSLCNKAIIRDQNFHYVVYKIGNGINVSIWNDNWAKVGVLSNYITHRSLYTARLSNSLDVADDIK